MKIIYIYIYIYIFQKLYISDKRLCALRSKIIYIYIYIKYHLVYINIYKDVKENVLKSF